MFGSADPLVMVVDDYDDVRSILRRRLEMRGCRVVEATGGKDAVEAAGREHPDLILMDLSMPEIDGFAATFRIRQIEGLEGVPIVAISAYGELVIDVQLQIDPQAVGFNEYVPKPFGPEQLLELLDRFLPRSSRASGVRSAALESMRGGSQPCVTIDEDTSGRLTLIDPSRLRRRPEARRRACD